MGGLRDHHSHGQISAGLCLGIFAIILGLLCQAFSWVPGVEAVNGLHRPVLRFNNEGTFKILQVADMHYGDGSRTPCRDLIPSQLRHCSDHNTTAFIARLLAAEKPDLVVFTGDNIDFDSSNATKSLDEAIAPVIAAKIPWAAILGNHDQESTLSRGEVMSYLTQMDYSLCEVLNPYLQTLLLGKDLNPSAKNMDVYGFGNYYLQVFGALESESENSSLLNLYFLDSGDYAKFREVGGYEWIRSSQLVWFRSLSAKLRFSNVSAAERLDTLSKQVEDSPPITPALAYFHIPLPEYKTVLESPKMILGEQQEEISSPLVNSGLFTALLEAGDVKATFVGHDHVNDYCGNFFGIHLCFGGGTGYHAYGKVGWPRRARVVLATLGWESKGGSRKTREIVTWKRLDDESMSQIDLQVLYNGYEGWWFTKPFYKGRLSFGRRGNASMWIASLLITIILLLMASSSLLINVLYRHFLRQKRGSYVPVENSHVESNGSFG